MKRRREKEVIKEGKSMVDASSSQVLPWSGSDGIISALSLEDSTEASQTFGEGSKTIT
jgi:hypothetical protein